MDRIYHQEHAQVPDVLYENGCVLCDHIEDLAETARNGTNVPWANEQFDEAECTRLIHQIKGTMAKF